MNHAPTDMGPASSPVLLPTDRPRRPGSPPRCTAVESAALDAGTPADGLGPRPAQAAAFAALLHRYTGQEDIGYDRADGAGTAHVRLRVTGAATLRELAASATTGPASAARPAPVALAFGDAARSADAEAPHELRIVVGDGTVALHYDSTLFEAGTAHRILAHYRTLLADALARPDAPVGELRLLTDAELRRMLVDWNRTETELADGTCLHEAFETHAEARPDATAVVHEGARSTYGDINAAANRLAHHLRSLGVGPDTRVGLCLERSPELLTAMLGILKAGGAYVPLDPDYPAQRIAGMVEGTTCAVNISRRELASRLPDSGDTPLVLLGPGGTDLSASPEHDPAPLAAPDHLCYVIHTSGSTGAPKPIALHHRGVVNNLADLNSRFAAGPGDSVLSLSSPSFDLSVYEYLGITAAGGTVVIPSAARGKDPAHWAELLAEYGVTVWNSAPALLDLLVDHLEQSGAEPLHRLRAAMLGGDWIPVPLPGRCRVVAPNMRMLTLGGATEASIHSTIYEVEEADPEWASIPYGRPLANQRTYILDDAFQPVPPGVTGELYLAGTGVARGYLDQPERTAERFIDWTHGEVSDRIYRTGDMARFGADGLIELLGRRDFQVKLNGLRVELGEIEAVLRSHPAVQQSAVVAHRNQLVAYAVAAAVRRSTSTPCTGRRRPAPAVHGPRGGLPLDRLPLTPSGTGRPQVPARTRPGRSRLPRAGHRLEHDPGRRRRRRPARGTRRPRRRLRRAARRQHPRLQVGTRARTRGLAVTPCQILQLRTAAASPGPPPRGGHRGGLLRAPLASAGRTSGPAAALPRLTYVWPLTPMQPACSSSRCWPTPAPTPTACRPSPPERHRRRGPHAGRAPEPPRAVRHLTGRSRPTRPAPRPTSARRRAALAGDRPRDLPPPTRTRRPSRSWPRWARARASNSPRTPPPSAPAAGTAM
ncbi:D-alanine--D-alanyl carrier protein ligase [Streptomyces alboniger]